MSSLRTQTIWSALPILITSVVSVVSVPIYFHVLGDEMYAMWFYVSTLTGAFGFMDLGMGVAVGRYMGVALGADDETAVREYWSTGNAIVLPLVAFFALVFIIIGAMWSPAWFKVSGADVATLQLAMVAGGIGLFFSYYGQMWFVLSATYLDFRFLSLLRTILSLVTTLGSIAVALATRSAAWLVVFSSLASAIQFLVLMHRGNHHYRMPLRIHDFKISRLVEMLPYTLKTFGQLISGSVLGSLDRILLGRLAPAADFAAYNVSLNVGSRVQGLSQAAMGPIFANSSRGVGGDQSRTPSAIYSESLSMLAPLYILVTMWVVAWHGPLLSLWLGKERGAMTSLSFPWIVAALSINAIANTSTAQLGALNRVGAGLVISTVQYLFAGALVYIGWHLDELRGASAGLFVSRLPLIVQDWIVRRHIGFHFGMREVRPILTATIIGVASLLLATIINLFNGSAWAAISAAFLTGALGTMLTLHTVHQAAIPSNHEAS